MRNAKIVCTLGPASDTRRTIERLADAGMAVARVNASHGTGDELRHLLETARSVDDSIEPPLATMLDLQGPEVRTGPIEPARTFDTDEELTFVHEDETVDPNELADTPDERTPDSTSATRPGSTSEQPPDSTPIPTTYSLGALEVGDRILLDDGRIEATVRDVSGDAVRARVDAGGEVAGRVGINVPGVDLEIDAVTEKDRSDLAIGVECDVDFVAASFVRDGADVLAVEEVLEEFGADVPIVAKIERAGAVVNLEDIVEAAYGVMVARGDLGVECPMEEVPLIQKRIVRHCRDRGRPVIIATEMLESMVSATRPTRAEASDVANAVLDGTDAVMLSAETAVGEDPVGVVEAMDRIVREVERSTEYVELRESRVPTARDSRTGALARAARYLARDLDASVVVAASESGYTALKTAKFSPGVPVVAATPEDRIRRRLALSGGVTPQYVPFDEAGADEVIHRSVQSALHAGVAESGDTVVVLSGMMTGLDGARTTNVLKVHVAAETIGSGRVIVEGRASGPVARPSTGDLSRIPSGAVLALPSDFVDEFDGDLEKIGAIVDERRTMTGYPALIARELDVPMVGGVDLETVPDGRIVTVDAGRGVVYDGKVGRDEGERS